MLWYDWPKVCFETMKPQQRSLFPQELVPFLKVRTTFLFYLKTAGEMKQNLLFVTDTQVSANYLK